MTEYHPLTQKVLDHIDTKGFDYFDREIDAIVREHTAPKTAQAEVRFPGSLTESVRVEATFIESGTQLQQVFIGTEPVLVVQPEYDADSDTVTMIVTAVDCDVFSLPEVLGYLLDGANEMYAQALRMRAEQEAQERDQIEGRPPVALELREVNTDPTVRRIRKAERRD